MRSSVSRSYAAVDVVVTNVEQLFFVGMSALVVDQQEDRTDNLVGLSVPENMYNSAECDYRRGDFKDGSQQVC